MGTARQASKQLTSVVRVCIYADGKRKNRERKNEEYQGNHHQEKKKEKEKERPIRTKANDDEAGEKDGKGKKSQPNSRRPCQANSDNQLHCYRREREG